MGLVAAALGLALFAWFIQRSGPALIWEGLTDVGWGFIVIVALAGLRFALRAIAWSMCVEAPAALPFGPAFAAVLAGDALGNLMPLGLIASEPAKAAFVRGRMPLGAAVTALTIENILYTLSVAAMIAASTLAMLGSFDLPYQLRVAGWIAVIAIATVFLLVAWLIWQRPALVSRVLSTVLPASAKAQTRIAQLGEVEDQVYAFARRHPATLMPIVGAEVAFHALGVVEVYVTWWFIQSVAPPFLIAFILEGALRFLVVAFKFVPLQFGVAEWGAGNVTLLLGYGVTVGVTLSIVRKVRTLFWVLIGTALLVRRGVRG
jgi:lysylphosphatidylglycerol synthase-like protein